MSEFLLLFRSNYQDIAKANPEQMKGYMQEWQKWIEGIVASKQLAGGNHLESNGRVVGYKGVITDGPYAEIKESILGYIIITATSYEEAVKIAKKCPLLEGENNTVEVRAIASIN